MPRTPNSAGIIPVKFKRKLNFKNSHMTQYVSVPKVIKAIQTLKALGHKYYQFPFDSESFLSKCQEEDVEGFNFLYPEDEIECDTIEQNHETEGPSEFSLVGPDDEIDVNEPDKKPLTECDSNGSDEEQNEKKRCN